MISKKSGKKLARLLEEVIAIDVESEGKKTFTYYD